MRRIILLLISTLPLIGYSQNVDWSNRVASIVYQKCATCHHQGGIGPFNLMSYSDAVAASAGIIDAVNNNKMPPWPPDTTYRKYAHQRTINLNEKNDLINWISAGMPAGNLTTAPMPPTFPLGTSANETPNLVAQIPSYTVTAATDIYQCFVVPSGISVDKYIRGFEVLPGNRSAVHHVLVFADTTGVCAALDNASPGPGYLSFGGTGSSSAQQIGAYVPGARAQFFPAGLGLRLPANADIVIQIHYPAGVAGQVDSTKVNFYFSTSASIRPVYISPALNHSTSLTNGPLAILANSTKTFYGEYHIPAIYGDISMLSVAPHMHLIGRNMTSYSVSPTNDTIPFIKINDWDFKWQGAYDFQKVQKIPAGSTLYYNAFYDNTLNNPYNPFTPPINITAGEATTNEMMMVYFTFMQYQQGDENIIMDSTLLNFTNIHQIESSNNLNVWPNPTNGDILNIESKDFINRKTKLILTDITGKIVLIKDINIGTTNYSLILPDLTNGLYILSISADNFSNKIKVNILN